MIDLAALALLLLARDCQKGDDITLSKERARKIAAAIDNVLTRLETAEARPMTTNTDTQAHGGGVEAVREASWQAVSDFVDEMLRDWPGGDDCRMGFGLNGATVTKGQFRAVQTALAALASPAATSAETQGGDGVREAETLWCESCGESPVSVRLDVAGLCAACDKEQGE